MYIFIELGCYAENKLEKDKEGNINVKPSIYALHIYRKKIMTDTTFGLQISVFLIITQ